MTSPRAYRALYAYTWDLAESDPGALDQEFARARLNTITIAAAYHAGKFTRPHGTSGKVYFPEDGVLHCQIDDAKFGTIKPEIGKLAQENNVFADFCQNSALDVTAWAVLMHNSRIGAQHPTDPPQPYRRAAPRQHHAQRLWRRADLQPVPLLARGARLCGDAVHPACGAI
ncbi:conserved hypothetical protein [Ketogulonicigenium vulgare Y25]|uniref:hypothetical protein n=1 Tax=Ketogulonicigenium vulgare TaxID=92945 RepID=UPI0001E67EBC|nr:hypothetical protein [Ketogulonicigenium vulgare]ADO42192.1 conserved hypothetical protein [Ketogulonicigenium vulgare Y25]